MMELGLIKIAEDSDFQHFRRIIDNHDDWELNYARDDTKVWTKCVPGIDFKMVKLVTVFDDVSPNVMYDVLHDPEYRRVWDKHMIEAHDIGYLNPNNDIGYYAMSCPVPLKNRDFVLQRSWLDMGTEQIIMNHSVNHKDYSEKPNYVRGISYITGYLIRPKGNSGCFVGYASQTDPKGTLPSWMVNKVTTIFAPKFHGSRPRIAVQCSKDADSSSTDEPMPFSCVPGIRFSFKFFSKSRRKSKKLDEAANACKPASDAKGKQKKGK
ncbi:Hypothetical predicted protein [Cloeon dipterum]|uniref:START domain-containing protein 10 n=1 Tax=Cloeon dipterum TaxID=197152 RepID=A0A8S1C345_9INSE|nr:Hypothetical predicted protein [Cloeon dipterum]